MIVVDASVLVNALADDADDGDLARGRLLADPDLHAPSLIDLEVLSVLRRQLRLGDLDDRRADLAETLECPLVTSDERLARASGLGCPVELLG